MWARRLREKSSRGELWQGDVNAQDRENVKSERERGTSWGS